MRFYDTSRAAVNGLGSMVHIAEKDLLARVAKSPAA